RTVVPTDAMSQSLARDARLLRFLEVAGRMFMPAGPRAFAPRLQIGDEPARAIHHVPRLAVDRIRRAMRHAARAVAHERAPATATVRIEQVHEPGAQHGTDEKRVEPHDIPPPERGPL